MFVPPSMRARTILLATIPLQVCFTLSASSIHKPFLASLKRGTPQCCLINLHAGPCLKLQPFCFSFNKRLHFLLEFRATLHFSTRNRTISMWPHPEAIVGTGIVWASSSVSFISVPAAARPRKNLIFPPLQQCCAAIFDPGIQLSTASPSEISNNLILSVCSSPYLSTFAQVLE